MLSNGSFILSVGPCVDKGELYRCAGTCLGVSERLSVDMSKLEDPANATKSSDPLPTTFSRDVSLFAFYVDYETV